MMLKKFVALFISIVFLSALLSGCYSRPPLSLPTMREPDHLSQVLDDFTRIIDDAASSEHLHYIGLGEGSYDKEYLLKKLKALQLEPDVGEPIPEGEGYEIRIAYPNGYILLGIMNEHQIDIYYYNTSKDPYPPRYKLNILNIDVSTELYTLAEELNRDGRNYLATTIYSTTTTLPSTGGDEGMCTEHYVEYHAIFSSVYRHFGDDADSVIQAFSDKYKGEDSNIINFVKEYNIDKETFIRLNGFTEDDWDKPWEGTAIAGSIIAGEYIDAIYSNDPAKIDAVFKRKEMPTSSTASPSSAPSTTVSAPTRTTTTKPK